MRVVKYNVKYDNIGGKIFYLEKEITHDEIEYQASNGNIACMNFIFRRDDFYRNNKKYYYGKIKKNRSYLGYVVCEDVIWEV